MVLVLLVSDGVISSKVMHAEAPKAEAEDPTEQQGGMYFQKVEVRALSITADYLPRRLDIVAMRAGSKAEVRLCRGISRPCGPDRGEDGEQYSLPSRGAHLHVARAFLICRGALWA